MIFAAEPLGSQLSQELVDHFKLFRQQHAQRERDKPQRQRTREFERWGRAVMNWQSTICGLFAWTILSAEWGESNVEI